MATVISLTEQKIRELLAGWEEVGLSQDQINALVAQLWTDQVSVNTRMEEFENVTLPSIQQEVGAASNRVSELNETTLPNLAADLAQANATIENLVTVDIPEIQAGLINEIENTQVRPQVFVQAEPPPAYDDLAERDLVVGDTWFDSDDNNMQRIWNGVEWSTFGIDIPDFSLTARKFLSTTHMIY